MNSGETNKTKKQGPIEFDVHFRIGRHGRQKLEIRQATINETLPQIVVPRITRLMALAIKMDVLLKSGVVQDYAELAVLGHVSRARITQIMNLIHLAPDIQEDILFLTGTRSCPQNIHERNIRTISKERHWDNQRKLWKMIRNSDGKV